MPISAPWLVVWLRLVGLLQAVDVLQYDGLPVAQLAQQVLKSKAFAHIGTARSTIVYIIVAPQQGQVYCQLNVTGGWVRISVRLFRPLTSASSSMLAGVCSLTAARAGLPDPPAAWREGK